MEAQTVPTDDAAPAAPTKAQAEKTPAKLFQWSGWVHVGSGADECPERFTGKCEDEDHFHAWCRLPNPYQQRDLAEKSRAAKARKIRAMKDPESDSYVVLEAALDEVRDTGKDALVQEALDREWPGDFEAAAMKVEGDERFEHQDQDREEYLRLRELPEEERGGEEFERLQAQMDAYGEEVQAALTAIQEPRREQLMAKDIEDLIAMARRERIESAGNEAYLHTYNTWMYYACTLKPRGIDGDGKPLRPKDMTFSHITQLTSAPTEVITEIAATFGTLEQNQAKGRAAKNS